MLVEVSFFTADKSFSVALNWLVGVDVDGGAAPVTAAGGGNGAPRGTIKGQSGGIVELEVVIAAAVDVEDTVDVPLLQKELAVVVVVVVVLDAADANTADEGVV